MIRPQHIVVSCFIHFEDAQDVRHGIFAAPLRLCGEPPKKEKEPLRRRAPFYQSLLKVKDPQDY